MDVVAGLTTGEGSELTSLIQSGDLSNAVQLASAAIAAVDVVAQTPTENQNELKQKRIAVIFCSRVKLSCLVRTSQIQFVCKLTSND